MFCLQGHGHHARRTQSALDKAKPDTASNSVPHRHVDVAHVPSSRRAPASQDTKMAASGSGPQRSLESPQTRNIGTSRDNSGGHAPHSPAAAAVTYFQRQDSCPMMRDRGHGPTYSRDLSAGVHHDPPGQYQVFCAFDFVDFVLCFSKGYISMLIYCKC